MRVSDKSDCLTALSIAQGGLKSARDELTNITALDNGRMCYPHRWTWQNMIVELDRDIEWIGNRIAKWDEEQEKLRKSNGV